MANDGVEADGAIDDARVMRIILRAQGVDALAALEADALPSTPTAAGCMKSKPIAFLIADLVAAAVHGACGA